MCFVPFRGIGGAFMRLRGKGPAARNPRYCDACTKFLNAFPGGAEVEMSIMFVDVRGSVSIAEQLKPAEFSLFMKGFFTAATQALIESDGFVIDFRGDCVTGVYPPGFSGKDHARKAFDGAKHLLRDMAPRAPDGSIVPIGIGVHTGVVHIGTISGAEGGMQGISILGDNANIAARLSQVAGPGEALISGTACRASKQPVEHLEARQVELKGKSTPISVRVLVDGTSSGLTANSND